PGMPSNPGALCDRDNLQNTGCGAPRKPRSAFPKRTGLIRESRQGSRHLAPGSQAPPRALADLRHGDDRHALVPPTEETLTPIPLPQPTWPACPGANRPGAQSAHLEDTAQLLGEPPHPGKPGSDEVSLFVSICQEKWRFA